MGRTIMHVDMDAFFAAVEQLYNPALKGRPVIVGGDPEGRGVVSAASYEARRFGIHSAMPMAWARKLCPQGVFLSGDFEKYSRASAMVFRILERYTPDVEEASVDEAYLDVTGCERLFGPPLAMAARIRAEISDRLGLSASIGIGTSRSAAKIASDLAKPAGILLVVPGREADFLAPLPVARMPGIGDVTERRMTALGIRTLADLARLDDGLLERVFGVCGPELRRKARGLDAYGLSDPSPRKSIGKENTFPRDVVERTEAESMLALLCEKVCRKLRRAGLAARTVTVKLRYADFRTVSRAKTFPDGVRYDSVVIPAALDLFRALDTRRLGIRLVGVSVSRLRTGVFQPSLFRAEQDLKEESLYRGIDAIRERFGFNALRRAAQM